MATTTVGGVAMSEAPITADGRATEGAAGKPTRAEAPKERLMICLPCLAEFATLTADICVTLAGMPS